MEFKERFNGFEEGGMSERRILDLIEEFYPRRGVKCGGM